MKKILATILAAAMMAASVPGAASAGDRGWATAGKILTGIIGLQILGNVIANAQPGPYYVPETRVHAPAPRYYGAPSGERVWIEGHHETRLERQWVPGHWEITRGRDLDDGDEWGDDDAHAGRRWVSGHYRTVEREVWIPGHWEDRG